ncbi:hypothetical protein C0991_010016, partial [Blastosporella zonata]
NLNKLRHLKFSRSTSALPKTSKVLDLPEGVKQIGGGIGFNYKVPVAARSKASICTNTPQTCHGLFQGRLHRLGIGLLRSPTAVAKAKAKRTLRSLVIPERQEDPRTAFPTDFRGSTWSLFARLESADTATVSSSPISEAEPPTPTTQECNDVHMGVVNEDEGFDEGSVKQEIRAGDDSEQMTTLRLVVPSAVKLSVAVEA